MFIVRWVIIRALLDFWTFAASPVAYMYEQAECALDPGAWCLPSDTGWYSSTGFRLTDSLLVTLDSLGLHDRQIDFSGNRCVGQHNVHCVGGCYRLGYELPFEQCRRVEWTPRTKLTFLGWAIHACMKNSPIGHIDPKIHLAYPLRAKPCNLRSWFRVLTKSVLLQSPSDRILLTTGMSWLLGL